MKTNILKKIPFSIIIVGIIFLIVFSSLSIYKHNTFKTGRDLAVHEDQIWNSLNGKLFYSEDYRANHLAVHFWIFQIFIFPIYKLFPFSQTLMFLHTIIFIMGGFLLYFISEKNLNKNISKIIVFIYFINPTIWNVNLGDFEMVSLAFPLLFLLLLFIEKKQWSGYYFTLIAFLFVQEQVALITVFLGAYLFLKKNKKEGLYTIIISIVWFILVINLIMPFLNQNNIWGEGYGFITIRYIHLGDTFSEVIKTVLFEPIYALTTTPLIHKIVYFLIFFIPFALLPLGTLAIIPAIPILIMNGLSNDFFQMCVTSHHNILLIPILFFALIKTLNKINTHVLKKRLLVVIIILSIISSIIFGILPWIKGFEKVTNIQNIQCFNNELNFYNQNNHDSQTYSLFLRTEIKKIPINKSITTTSHIWAHLTHRNISRSTYMYYNQETFDTDFLLFDFSDLDSLYKPNLSSEAIKSGYTLVWKKESLELFEKK